MGYNIRIGEAVPDFDRNDFPVLRVTWRVGEVNQPDAPVFLHDECTNNTNCRYPTYSGWKNFCHATGLFELFFDEDAGLMREHPGCQGITQANADEVTHALQAYRKKCGKEPGFEDPDGNLHGKDPQLARLIWLEYWMQWAIKHCDTPAIDNT